MIFALRRATPADQDVLWHMLYYAARMDEDGVVDLTAARDDVFLRPHADTWGQPGDLGIVAWNGVDAIGAAWVRSGTTIGHESAGFPVDAELALAVVPAAQGQGIGTTLLAALLACTDAAGRTVSLWVRTTNPAYRLYQRSGFVEQTRMPNRVGTESILMQRRYLS